MKIPKYLFLVLAVLSFLDFITLFFQDKNTHEFFLWEVNTWFYKAFKFFISLVFLKVYLDQNKIKSGFSE